MALPPWSLHELLNSSLILTAVHPSPRFSCVVAQEAEGLLPSLCNQILNEVSERSLSRELLLMFVRRSATFSPERSSGQQIRIGPGYAPRWDI
jgi:hypothetical protein